MVGQAEGREHMGHRERVRRDMERDRGKEVLVYSLNFLFKIRKKGVASCSGVHMGGESVGGLKDISH